MLLTCSPAGLLALTCVSDQALLSVETEKYCLMYWQNVVCFSPYCFPPASPVALTAVLCGFLQVTVPSGARALLFIKFFSNS